MNETWWVNPEQLDDDQKKVIAAPINKSHLVLGPPGSGKSNLLLLRADYLQRAGHPNTLIMVFTRQLQEFMVSGSTNYSFQASKIKTSRAWMLELLRAHDVKITLSEDFRQSRIELLKHAQGLVNSRKIGCIYEMILLDEAQDYWPEEIQLFASLSKHLFAVADARQKIYPDEDPIETIKAVVDQTHLLRFHYRNGLNICRLADGIAKESDDYEPLAVTSNYNEVQAPSTIEVKKTKDIRDQCDLILGRIQRQLKAYPDEYIGIITPRREELNDIAQYFMKTDLYANDLLQIREDGDTTFDPNKPIILTTLHSAKGLEFRVLHVASLEHVTHFPKQRNMCFTAVTRAKTALYIYHSGDLPGYFEQAYVNLQRPPELPSVDDLFVKEDF